MLTTCLPWCSHKLLVDGCSQQEPFTDTITYIHLHTCMQAHMYVLHEWEHCQHKCMSSATQSRSNSSGRLQNCSQHKTVMKASQQPQICSTKSCSTLEWLATHSFSHLLKTHNLHDSLPSCISSTTQVIPDMYGGAHRSLLPCFNIFLLPHLQPQRYVWMYWFLH